MLVNDIRQNDAPDLNEFYVVLFKANESEQPARILRFRRQIMPSQKVRSSVKYSDWTSESFEVTNDNEEEA